MGNHAQPSLVTSVAVSYENSANGSNIRQPGRPRNKNPLSKGSSERKKHLYHWGGRPKKQPAPVGCFVLFFKCVCGMLNFDVGDVFFVIRYVFVLFIRFWHVLVCSISAISSSLMSLYSGTFLCCALIRGGWVRSSPMVFFPFDLTYRIVAVGHVVVHCSFSNEGWDSFGDCNFPVLLSTWMV